MRVIKLNNVQFDFVVSKLEEAMGEAAERNHGPLVQAIEGILDQFDDAEDEAPQAT